MLATLRRRDFALLWTGGLISVTGDWVLSIGLPIYVLILSHSVLATSIILISGRIPSLLLGPLAGVFVDRWNRKRILVVGNMLSALALLPLLLVTTDDRIWIVNVVAFVEACVEQFFVPPKTPWCRIWSAKSSWSRPTRCSRSAAIWPDWLARRWAAW